jgi:L-ascorbate metabolism protein UlaG (beta-lactamase superfamily)
MSIANRHTKIVVATALLMSLLAAILLLLHFRPSVDANANELRFQQGTSKHTGLRAVFFGTSTIVLTDGTNAIMTDGFFSRPSWLRLLTSIESDPAAISFALSKAPRKVDALFVAHSHHDHAMDSGLVAQKTGAVVHGSESTLNVARGQRTPESQLRLLKAGQAVVIGEFRVTPIETPHSDDPINPGFITHPVEPPAKIGDYRAAENYSFFVEHPLGRILIVPSANYRLNAFDGIQADIVMLGVGAVGKQSAEFVKTYWEEVVSKTGATLVVPVHWDDFTQSLRDPLVPLPFFADNMNIAMKRLRALAQRDGVEIRFLPPLQEVTLPAGNPPAQRSRVR